MVQDDGKKDSEPSVSDRCVVQGLSGGGHDPAGFDGGAFRIRVAIEPLFLCTTGGLSYVLEPEPAVKNGGDRISVNWSRARSIHEVHETTPFICAT